MSTEEESAAGLSIESQYGQAALPMRSYLSTHHLWAGRHFTKLAKEIEAAHTGRSTFSIEHRAYVLGSIMCAVGFLEAAINEVYQDAHDGHMGYIMPLGFEVVAGLKQEWLTTGSGRREAVEKYQRVLELMGLPKYDTGRSPIQDVGLAVDLRNALVHYRPETLTERERSRFEKNIRHKLKGKYPTNLLMQGSKNPPFMDHYLGAGCSAWVLDTLVKFVDDFFRRIGVVPNYQRVQFALP